MNVQARTLPAAVPHLLLLGGPIWWGVNEDLAHQQSTMLLAGLSFLYFLWQATGHASAAWQLRGNRFPWSLVIPKPRPRAHGVGIARAISGHLRTSRGLSFDDAARLTERILDHDDIRTLSLLSRQNLAPLIVGSLGAQAVFVVIAWNFRATKPGLVLAILLGLAWVGLWAATANGVQRALRRQDRIETFLQSVAPDT